MTAFLYGYGTDKKLHPIRAVANGDGTYSLDIGSTDVTLGELSIPALGSTDDNEWSGSGDGTGIAIAKASWITLDAMNTWLNTIAGNTNTGADIQAAVESSASELGAIRTILEACQTALEQIQLNTAG